MSYKCLTNVLQMSYKYLTNVLQMSYKCLTNVFQMPSKCLMNALWMSYKCLTSIMKCCDYLTKCLGIALLFQVILLQLAISFDRKKTASNLANTHPQLKCQCLVFLQNKFVWTILLKASLKLFCPWHKTFLRKLPIPPRSKLECLSFPP